ncbi:hypothetical protein [Paraburkholderia sp. ZP32-5]|uniref:hypothetical protein n=1 Tax=Paraburkholderia sp. ZP32-5 TaxID=2883245 RepID=UPI001F1C2F71|nr:hypothetical protein [Paraburkholderia sp. ZP32-5]
MAKSTKSRSENSAPDVEGALKAIHSKQSREQIRIERLRPFMRVIDEALKKEWSWSAILALIREHGGPSFTKKEAEYLRGKIKQSSNSGNKAEQPSWIKDFDQSAGVPQSGVVTEKESA